MVVNTYNAEVVALANTVETQFINRTIVESRKGDKDFKNSTISYAIKDNTLWFHISVEEDTYSITMPVPFIENGIVFIEANEVKRALCPHFDVQADKIVDYLEVMRRIFIGDPTNFVTLPTKKKDRNSSFVQQLAWAIINNNLSIKVYNLQKAINEIISKMPLHETYMNSFTMNNRLICIDPEFDNLSSPDDLLNYQTEKNRKYFSRGWTSIGLSDGTLASKNYILTTDIKQYTPFGINYHNPQRNLYSTLSMKGDELPRITTTSGMDLINYGIKRKGWNLFTAYVDVPDTFEDQILVNAKHADKFTEKERRFQCFGEMLVKVGDSLKFGQAMSKSIDGETETFKVIADSAHVIKIITTTTTVGNLEVPVYNVIVKMRRYFKDGTKFTNTHGNKGIIRLVKNLGYAIDPGTGEQQEIDVIVSAKTIKKRKNYGQLLEALYNNINERKNEGPKQENTEEEVSKDITTIASTTRSCWSAIGVGTTSSVKIKTEKIITKIKHEIIPVVIADDYKILNDDINNLKEELVSVGLREDATWDCNTYAGDVTTVCGTVFWGVIKDPEDQLWDKTATMRTNGKGMRTAGLKFSTVEFRALETRFGKNNPIMNEVLTYTQGTENINELIEIIRSKKFQFNDKKSVINFNDVKAIDQKSGTVFKAEAIEGTICDENYYKDGFILQLPVMYQTSVGFKSIDTVEGMPFFTPDNVDWDVYKAVYNTDKIYVPAGILRKSWRHGTSLFGLSEVAVLLNNIVMFSKNYMISQSDPQSFRLASNLLYRAIRVYFARVANILSTKNGEIATYGMSVRYPFSVKGTATLSNELPPNTVEIHSSMAKTLEIKHGDICLVERFPCLGFMGVRPQQIFITEDPMCKYTLRASGNSLVSTNLDFDGDVFYIAAFHTPEAKAALRKEWETPTPACWDMIHKLNIRKGEPEVNSLTLNDYDVKSFNMMSEIEHAAIVRKLTGVKAQTGPVIALAYNLMRVLEKSNLNIDKVTEVGIEMFIEKAGQSVFEQKHGGTSLCDIVIEAICTGDVNSLTAEGFDSTISNLICGVIKAKASELGVNDLVDYHEKYGKLGSHIINRIVRTEHRIYFASRAYIEGCAILECLEAPVVDLPSRIFKLTTSGKYGNCKTMLDKIKDQKLLSRIKDPEIKAACESMFGLIDTSLAA